MNEQIDGGSEPKISVKANTAATKRLTLLKTSDSLLQIAQLYGRRVGLDGGQKRLHLFGINVTVRQGHALLKEPGAYFFQISLPRRVEGLRGSGLRHLAGGFGVARSKTA